MPDSGVTLFFIILGVLATEGILLYKIYLENKKLKIDKIKEDADVTVQKMDDATLLNDLHDELK